MKKFLNWIVYSSINADKISLTIKGILIGIIPYAIFALGLAHVNTNSDALTQIADTIVTIIQYVGGTIAAITTLIGLIRKFSTSAAGTNAVLNPNQE